LPNVGWWTPQIDFDDFGLRGRGSEFGDGTVIKKLISRCWRGEPMDSADLAELSRERGAPRVVERFLE
jgi:hypothetical protein